MVYQGTLFQRTLRSELVARGWQLDALQQTPSLDWPALVCEFLSGKAVRVRRADGSGPPFTSQRKAPDDAAKHVAEQIGAFVAAERLRLSGDVRRMTSDEIAEDLRGLLGVRAANQ